MNIDPSCSISNSSCSSCTGGIVKLKTSKAFHMCTGFDLELEWGNNGRQTSWGAQPHKGTVPL